MSVRMVVVRILRLVRSPPSQHLLVVLTEYLIKRLLSAHHLAHCSRIDVLHIHRPVVVHGARLASIMILLAIVVGQTIHNRCSSSQCVLSLHMDRSRLAHGASVGEWWYRLKVLCGRSMAFGDSSRVMAGACVSATHRQTANREEMHEVGYESVRRLSLRSEVGLTIRNRIR